MLQSMTDNAATSLSELNNASGGAVAVDRAIRGGSFQSLAAAAHLPYQDRCAYVHVPELALRGKPPLKPEEVWDTFSKDFAPVKDFFCCIQMVRPNRLRVWCPSSTVLEDVLNTGLTLRGHPLRIKLIIDRCWLTVTHLPYGLSEQAIRQFFEAFGEVRAIRFVQFRQVHTGTIKVLMALRKTVSTRIQILGHAGLVYHPGQVRTCFHCGATGHESKRCPGKKTPSPKPRRKRQSPKNTAVPETTQRPSSGPSNTTVPPDNSHNLRSREAISDANPPSTPIRELANIVLSDEDEQPEVFSSPKGTFGPPKSDTVDTHIEHIPANPPTKERPAPDAGFTDPPPVQQQQLNTNRKAPRRKTPAPLTFGIDLVCSPLHPPVSLGGKEQTDTGTVSSRPPITVSSSSATGPRTLT